MDVFHCAGRADFTVRASLALSHALPSRWQGEFKLIDKMMGVQGEVFHTPTILLSGAVSGEEEAPAIMRLANESAWLSCVVSQ